MDAIAQYPIIGELFMLIKNNLLGAFFVISCFFEFSKIKINPISGAMDYLFKPKRTSSIYNGQLFSEQEYQHIFEIIEQYNELHEIYKFSNGHTDDAIAEIKSHHDKYKDSNVKYF